MRKICLFFTMAFLVLATNISAQNMLDTKQSKTDKVDATNSGGKITPQIYIYKDWGLYEKKIFVKGEDNNPWEIAWVNIFPWLITLTIGISLFVLMDYKKSIEAPWFVVIILILSITILDFLGAQFDTYRTLSFSLMFTLMIYLAYFSVKFGIPIYIVMLGIPIGSFLGKWYQYNEWNPLLVNFIILAIGLLIGHIMRRTVFEKHLTVNE